jgi:hypothetical protein
MEDVAAYSSYASSDLSPARLLQNRRFNHALVSLLDLLRQLVEFGKQKDRGWGVDNIEWVHLCAFSNFTHRFPFHPAPFSTIEIRHSWQNPQRQNLRSFHSSPRNIGNANAYPLFHVGHGLWIIKLQLER